MLASKVLGELVEYLPEPARDAVVDLRDYVQKHGRFPKFTPLRQQPLASGESAQALGAFLGNVESGASLRMVNLLKGEVRGGSVRGVNLIAGDILGGEVRGGNLVLGAVRGGALRGINLIFGDLHAGEARAVNVMVGNVHGGELKCQLLIGDVHGGKVAAKYMHGRKLGGDVSVERELDENAGTGERA
ncbi:MAG TPA: hypothetical protein VHM19_14570 [Polyangiales bacterium]|nr:hypothetical protein [Polyangiales bacterium]